MLDKHSPVPLYYQLYTILLKRIQDGELKPGDSIPTETALMEEYEISRATVRQSIMMLVNGGYLYREKSKGTFVKKSDQNVRYVGRVKGFTATSREGDIPLRSVILEKAVVEPSANIREALRLSDGEKVFMLRRVRFINDEPNTYVEDYLPYKICPGIEAREFVNDSLYDTLETYYRIIPHHAKRIFESVKPSQKEEMEHLACKPSSTLLRVESYVYMEDDTPVEYYTALVKGRYTVDV